MRNIRNAVVAAVCRFSLLVTSIALICLSGEFSFALLAQGTLAADLLWVSFWVLLFVAFVVGFFEARIPCMLGFHFWKDEPMRNNVRVLGLQRCHVPGCGKRRQKVFRRGQGPGMCD